MPKTAKYENLKGLELEHHIRALKLQHYHVPKVEYLIYIGLMIPLVLEVICTLDGSESHA